MNDGPLRHSDYRPRCRDCEAAAVTGCLRCGRPLCARCEPPPDRRCARCERQWCDHARALSLRDEGATPARLFCIEVLVPSLAAATLAFAVLVAGGGNVLAPLAMALALVAAVNLPLVALGRRELAADIREARARGRIAAARRRFLAARPPW